MNSCFARIADVFHLFLYFVYLRSHLGLSLPMEYVMIMQRESKWRKEDLMKMKMRRTLLPLSEICSGIVLDKVLSYCSFGSVILSVTLYKSMFY